MKWRESISGIYYTRTNQSEFDSKPEFYAAASVDDIALAEAKLHTTFPHCLRSLLLETNGVMEMMKIDTGEWFENIWLVWTIQEIAEQNLAYRAESAKGTIERNFNELVFFSSVASFPKRIQEGKTNPSLRQFAIS